MQTPNDVTALLRERAYLREADILGRVFPGSHASLWRAVKANRFPQPQKITERITGWRTADLIEWIEGRARTCA